MRLRAGDVTEEVLLQERARAGALVEPVAEQQVLVLLGVVAVLELALRAVRQARERGRRTEERLDEVRLVARRCTSRRRVERATRDGALDVALQSAGDPQQHLVAVAGCVVGAVPRAGQGAARVRHEGAVVLFADPERAVPVLVHLHGSRDRVVGPRATGTAAVGRVDDNRGLVWMRLFVAMARIREGERREGEGADDENRNCQQTFHVSRPLSHGFGPCLSTLPGSLASCTSVPGSSVDFLRVLYSGRV